jgi:hypothetical protein
MDKCRDLQNKLRGCLLDAPTHTFSIDDFESLFKLISEGTEQKIDIKLLTHFMMRRSIKSIAYMPNGKGLTKFVNFFEFLYKTNPIYLSFLPMEMKFIIYRAHQLGEQEELSLNDMTKLAKIMVPSLYKPSFFFNEMIKT